MNTNIDLKKYLQFISAVHSTLNNSTQSAQSTQQNSTIQIMFGGSQSQTQTQNQTQPEWIDNFDSIYEPLQSEYANIYRKSTKSTYSSMYEIYGRAMAYDDKMKKKKKGFYRVKYEDKNDLDKKGNPKTKFKYFHMSDNRPVTEEEQIRINKLGLAPAYEDVWVSDDPNSKIQATGIDVKGRKQYRYTQKHVEGAGIDKFLRLYKFIKSIPKLDKAMETDLNGPNYTKNKTISIMLSIVKELNMRVGKECYAKTNKSYGVTSLKKSHVKIDEEKMVAKFNFKAKSNKQVQYTLENADIVKQMIPLFELEGEKLFQYKSDSNSGNIQRATDVDLNQYIQEKMGKDFSCKDFRTYAANFYFIKALLKETKKRNPVTQKIAKKNISLAQENTAYYLRHTKSISKKSYTMDLIRDMYMNESDFFIENKNKQPLTILLEILKIFKDKINAERKKSGKEEVDEEKVDLSKDDGKDE
jgi:DNA topoisomerase-1